jgi:hypothetical protein
MRTDNDREKMKSRPMHTIPELIMKNKIDENVFLRRISPFPEAHVKKAVSNPNITRGESMATIIVTCAQIPVFTAPYIFVRIGIKMSPLRLTNISVAPKMAVF